MNNAVIYARYSSTGQNEQSIEGQVRVCREFAESKGFTVVKIYMDKAKTGTNDNRPDFQRMLNAAETGAYQNIIVYKFDRFARNRFDSMMHKQQLKKRYNIRVISALEPVSDDEGGEIYEMFLEWNDEKYSQRLSKRIRDGLTTSVENGTYTGCKLICGYKLIDTNKTGKKGIIHRVTVDEEQAEIIKYLFEEYAKGATKKNIAAELNAKGYRYKGKPFQSRVFEKWLDNEKYTGEFTFGGRTCNNQYPQIIDKALFIKVQERLHKNRHVAGGVATAREPYTLTGKAFCGICETGMVADGSTSKTGRQHRYYACKQKKKGNCDKQRNNKDALELYVTQCVHNFLSDPKNAEIAVKDTLAYYERKTGEDSLRSVEVKISNARKEVDELANAFIKAKSDLLQASIERKMNDYEILLKDLLAQEAQLKLERRCKVTKQDLLYFIAELLKGDPNGKEYQRKIVDNLIYKVYVYDGYKVVYISINGGKGIEGDQVSLTETNTAVNKAILGVQTLSPILHQTTIYCVCFY